MRNGTFRFFLPNNFRFFFFFLSRGFSASFRTKRRSSLSPLHPLSPSQRLPDMSDNIDYATEPKGFYSDNSSSGTAPNVAPISLLTSTILPPDSYTADGTYWADLPHGERSAFINKQMNEETLRELRVVGAMAKKDPFSPIGAYMSRYAGNGMVSSIPLLS